MRSAQVLAVCAALVGLVVAGAGCFKPNVLSGGFSCGDAGIGKMGICPDGLVCDGNNHCVTSTGGAGGNGGTGGKGGQAGGTGGVAGQPGTGGMGGQDAGPCLDPIANCQPTDAGMCDPVCNTGCDCHDKCSVNSSGALTCNVPTTTRTTTLFGSCDPAGFGAAQTDDCQPGQVCVSQNACQYRCYQFCRTNADCPTNSSCSISVAGGYSMCDVPTVACDPVNGAARSPATSGCPSPTACYLSSSSSSTLCDCENNRTDGLLGREGDNCSKSRDCFGGLICLDPTSTGAQKKCYAVCRLPSADGGSNAQPGETGCTVGGTPCSQIALPNGMTNPTFGFCNE